MITRKKHSYLLLELLISLSILLICLGPLLSAPFACLKKQERAILSLQLHKKGEELLFFVEEELRTKHISWETVEKSYDNPVSLELPSHLLTEPLLSNIQTTLQLVGAGRSIDKEKNQIGTLHIHAHFYHPAEKKAVYTTSSILFVSKGSIYNSVDTKT